MYPAVYSLFVVGGGCIDGQYLSGLAKDLEFAIRIITMKEN